eukprot:8332479-Pyramimonas_sp.AAC.1
MLPSPRLIGPRTCGVTPHAQKRGTSAVKSTVGGSPKSEACRFGSRPKSSGRPTWTGAPCTVGNCDVTCGGRR